MSQLTELWPCISGTTQRDCPWIGLRGGGGLMELHVHSDETISTLTMDP